MFPVKDNLEGLSRIKECDAEEDLRARGIRTVVPGFAGLPAGVGVPAAESQR